MIALLRRLIDGPDDGLPAQLARLKAETADLPKPKRIEGMEWPERDDTRPACTHMWGTDGDVLNLELQAEQEQERSNVRVFARGSK